MALTDSATVCDIIDLTAEDDYTYNVEILDAAASKAQHALSPSANDLASLTPLARLKHTSRDYNSTASHVSAQEYLDKNLQQGDKAATAPTLESKTQVAASRLSPTRPKTPTTAVNNERDDITPGRKPRAAAIDANRSIARDYDFLNPLEAWHEASVHTPRKPGRPPKDEWKPTKQYTPGSGSSRSSQSTCQNPGLSKEDPASPVPKFRTSNIVNGKGQNKLGGAPIIQKKRKSSSPLLDVGFLTKTPRTKHFQYGDSILTQESIDNKNLKHDIPDTVPLQLTRDHQNLDQAGNHNVLSTSPPNTRILDTANPSDDAVPWEMFSTVVYTSIKKALKHYKGLLTEEELNSIGTSVAADIISKKSKIVAIERLALPDDEMGKQIKRLVREDFGRKITRTKFPSRREPSPIEVDPATSDPSMVQEEKRAVNVCEERQSQMATTIKEERRGVLQPAKAARITDLAGYLTKLENETLGFEPQEAEQIGDFSCENASNSGSSRQSLAEQPHSAAVALPPGKSPLIASTANASPQPVFASDEAFPPGFDRGRYPMQRRRRGNKFYTPERKQIIPGVESVSHPQQGQGMVRLPKSQSIEAQVVQVLAKRSISDKHLAKLLTFTASGKATTSEVAELDRYIKRIRASLTSDKGGLTSHTQASSGLAGNVNGVANTESSMRSPDDTLDPPLYNNINTHKLSSSEQRSALVLKDINTHASQREVGQDVVSVPETQTLPMSTTDSRRDADKLALNARVTANSLSDNLGTSHLNNYSRTVSPMVRPVVASLAEDEMSFHRPLSTALDPHLELLAAVSVLDDTTPPGPEIRDNKYKIRSHQQRELLTQPNIVIRAESMLGTHADSRKPKVVRIESKAVDPARRPQQSTASLLRHRELGSDSRGRHVNTQHELRLRTAEKLEPWRSWKGASGDIVAAAWAPDSVIYAVGAAAHTNTEDLQYNRPCNLLLGDITSNILRELPNHRVDRPRPETLASGPNATQAIYDACDPMVYETVTSIAFAPTGHRMFTASHDRTVKIWDTARKSCLYTLRHESWVTSVEVSSQRPGLFATATREINDAIRIYSAESTEDYPVHSCFSSSKAKAKPNWQIYPECLRWGSTPATDHLLLAGFHQWKEDSNGLGELVLWDAGAFASIKVSPSAQSVYAAAWHPHSNLFATGGAPSGTITNRHSTKSVVRTWDLRSTTRYAMEYECSALDMQDVTFSPLNPNIVTAGCTDGASYVWDFRRPEHPLHRLQHDQSIVELDHTRNREEVDTGVMMSVWGLGGTLFYTGSSDGMVKAWDVRRHPADVLVRNVARFDAGVQSGAFSPDGTNLLVGDADGAFHILSSAPCGPLDLKYEGIEEPIDLIRASDGSGLKLENDDDNPGTEGRELGKELIESGQLELHPEFGVTRGQYYHGPWARDSRKDDAEPNKLGRLLPEYAKLQAFSRKGVERPEIAERRRGLIRARKLLIDDELNKHRLDPATAQESHGDDPITPLAIPTLLPQPAEPSQLVQQPTGTTPPMTHEQNTIDSTANTRPSKHDRSGLPKAADTNISTAPAHKTLFGAKNNTIPESRMVAENYWWPRLGEAEIMKAREQARMGRG